MDICLPVCGGVSPNFFKKSSYYNWTLTIPFGGVFLEIRGNLLSLYYYWTLPVQKLMVYAKLFSYRRKSPDYSKTAKSAYFCAGKS